MIEKAVLAGIDAVEIGFPSQNPYLDGETIKQAHRDTIHNFSTLTDFIDYLALLRSRIDIPIWIMGYEEDLLAEETYLKLAKSSYINGFVIPNLSVEAMTTVRENVLQENIHMIPVINNQMKDEQILSLIDQSEVVYCQLYAGKTGNAFSDMNDLPHFHKRIRKLTDAKLMAGFGIKNSEIAQEIFYVGFDGIVIGSEIVRLVNTGDENELLQFVSELKKTKLD